MGAKIDIRPETVHDQGYVTIGTVVDGLPEFKYYLAVGRDDAALKSDIARKRAEAGYVLCSEAGAGHEDARVEGVFAPYSAMMCVNPKDSKYIRFQESQKRRMAIMENRITTPVNM